jgi:hypothetical protein
MFHAQVIVFEALCLSGNFFAIFTFPRKQARLPTERRPACTGLSTFCVDKGKSHWPTVACGILLGMTGNN